MFYSTHYTRIQYAALSGFKPLFKVGFYSQYHDVCTRYISNSYRTENEAEEHSKWSAIVFGSSGPVKHSPATKQSHSETHSPVATH